MEFYMLDSSKQKKKCLYVYVMCVRLWRFYANLLRTVTPELFVNTHSDFNWSIIYTFVCKHNIRNRQTSLQTTEIVSLHFLMIITWMFENIF